MTISSLNSSSSYDGRWDTTVPPPTTAAGDRLDDFQNRQRCAGETPPMCLLACGWDATLISSVLLDAVHTSAALTPP